jgi:hypothetical protein
MAATSSPGAVQITIQFSLIDPQERGLKVIEPSALKYSNKVDRSF